MDSIYTKRYLFKALMGIALFSGILFFYINHIDFMAAAFEYGKMNVPNIAYSLLRIIIGIIIPVLFIVPSIFEYSRIRLTKIAFIAYGVCHIITLSWIIYFFATQPASDFFNYEKVSTFLYDGGFIYQFTIWDTYSLASIPFTIIYGALAIYIGMNFDKNKNIIRLLLTLLLAFRVALPFISDIIFQERLYTEFWIANNYMELVSQLCFTIAIWIASTEDATWVEFVWDELVFPENAEDQALMEDEAAQALMEGKKPPLNSNLNRQQKKPKSK